MQRFVIADPSLREAGSHHATTTLRFAEAAKARGFEVIIAAHESLRGLNAPVRLIYAFQDTIYDRGAGREPIGGLSGRWVPSAASDFLRLQEGLQLTDDDVVFFHTSTLRSIVDQLEGLVSSPREHRPSLHFLLRYPPQAGAWAGGDADVVAFRDMEPRVRIHRGVKRVFLYAETEDLASEYQRLLGVRVECIPHFPSFRPSEWWNRRSRNSAADPMRVAYLGEARVEKGFNILPGAVRRAYDETGGGFQFACQYYISSSNRSSSEVPALESALEEIWEDLKAGRNYTLEGPLSDEDYLDHVARTDVFLVPHRVPEFESRGSGVFLDAVATGATVIVREGTWMARRGGLVNLVRFKGDDDLAEKIVLAVRSKRDRDLALLSTFNDLFSPETGIRAILHNHIEFSAGRTSSPSDGAVPQQAAPIVLRGAQTTGDNEVTVTAESDLFGPLWFGAERWGYRMVRWMPSEGLVFNPVPERPLVEVRVYIAKFISDEIQPPDCYLDHQKASVQVELQESGDNPVVLRITPAGPPGGTALSEVLRLQSSTTVRPYDGVTTFDERHLSIAVSAVTFLYA